VSQAELARKSELSDGFVCKIVARLIAENYLIVNDARALRPRDPNVLLDAWLDAYDFDRHRILVGRVPASSGEDVLCKIVAQLSAAKIDYAVTGSAAAWLRMKTAAFNVATIYVPTMPSRAFLKKINFTEQPQEGNLRLVVPNDDGVFHGSQQQAGIQSASPLQIYLDLKGQPEPVAEAAAELRKKFLNWGQHGK
jgi:hypothetical protein